MSSKNSSSHEDSSSDSNLSAAFNKTAARQLDQENRCSTTQKQKPQAEHGEQQEQQEDASNEANTVQTETHVAHEASTAIVEQPRVERENRSLPRRKQVHPMSHAERLRREVCLLQKSPCFMIPRLPFGRLVREIIQQHSASTTCITRGALEALQTATEMFVTQRFQDSYLMTMHRGRVTLQVRDMALMAAICKLHGQL